mmetsp:Transcript_6973/g.10187  ORF Transcript_6973/g.10187 Transcript_6973/m.10187 type:complete len:80 (+) Transcript_6973:196-435(+)
MIQCFIMSHATPGLVKYVYVRIHYCLKMKIRGVNVIKNQFIPDGYLDGIDKIAKKTLRVLVDTYVKNANSEFRNLFLFE